MHNNKKIQNPQLNKKYKLLSVEQWLLLDETTDKTNIGILLQTSIDVVELISTLQKTPIIALDFSNFDDGRSYSQVRLLRKLLNSKTEIRALNVHIDHLQFIVRSGVDSYELLPQYQHYNLSYATDFSICYQAAQNNDGMIEKHIF